MAGIELSAEDRAAIETAIGDNGCYNDDPCCGSNDEVIYRAGLRAGLERAAKMCSDAAQGYAAEAEGYAAKENRSNAYYGDALRERREASLADEAAIRALLDKD